MGHAIVLNAAVNLIIGLALLLAWRSDRELAFPRDLGLAFLVQVLVSVGFYGWRTAPAPWHLAGFGLMALASSLYLALIVVGCARLAERAIDARRIWQIAALLLVVHTPLAQVDFTAAQVSAALLVAAAGAVATYWLWHRGALERAAGLLLTATGLNQLMTPVVGLDWMPVQLTSGAVLRLAFGTTLLFATLRRSVQRAERLHERFFRLTERSHQGVGVMRDNTVLYANPAVHRIYGVDSMPKVASRWREATIPEAEREAARERHRAIVAGEVDHAEWEADRTRLDGTPLRLRFSAWRVDWDGEPAEQIVVSDVTAVHNALRDKLHQATHDELTGTPNRSALMQRLRQLTVAGEPFTLLVLDIDRFALINDAHGPSVGDEVLRELARRLAGRFAGRAEVMRLGEDEFALLAAAPGAAEAVGELTGDVRSLLAEPLPAAGNAFYLDVSMGIALHPHTAADPERLLRAANAAMHEAKAVPGTSRVVAEERFERGSGASLAAEQALRAGLPGRSAGPGSPWQQAFFLVFQPKLAARSRTLAGFEALLRWQRGDGTLVPPAEFIPAAERTGLILPLGQQVVEMACERLAAWRDAGAALVPVAVNVSRWQLLDDGFAPAVLRTLQRHRLAPQHLVLEITETAAMQHFEQVCERAAALREMGLALSLDDFGTGLSSLTALREIALHEIKIDRGLIAPLPDAGALAVVQAVCTLARTVGLQVVAEGVETEAQAAAAAEAGCDALQGYHFARPLEGDAAAAWLGSVARSVA